MVARLKKIQFVNTRITNRWNPFKKPAIEIEIVQHFSHDVERKSRLTIQEGDSADFSVIKETERPVIR